MRREKRAARFGAAFQYTPGSRRAFQHWWASNGAWSAEKTRREWGWLWLPI